MRYNKPTDETFYSKPTDEECLELMRQMRSGEFRAQFTDSDEDDERECEIFARYNRWYPGLFQYMMKMSDQEALEKAKEAAKPILL